VGAYRGRGVYLLAASTPTAAMGPRSRFAASCCTAWRPLRRAGLPSQPSWPRATA